MGEAYRIAKERFEEDKAHVAILHDRLLERVSQVEEVYFNGSLLHKVKNILNISFNFIEGESLIMALENVAVSSGSACTSATLEPSYVLRALGRADELAHSSIRFSFGRQTTIEDINQTADILLDVVEKLRQLSPLWDMYQDGVDMERFNWSEYMH